MQRLHAESGCHLSTAAKLGLPPAGAFNVHVDVAHLTHGQPRVVQGAAGRHRIATAAGIDTDPIRGNGFIRVSFAISEREVERALLLLGPWLERLGERTYCTTP